jgi:hypothetical protein
MSSKKVKAVAARGVNSEAFARLWNATSTLAPPTASSVITKKRKKKATRSDQFRDHHRGGPIQHANRFLIKLCRREQRGGQLSKPRLMRIVEIAVAASHTPKIFSRAARRVGWAEDDSGKLVYDPMASCDKTVLTGYRSAASAAAGAASAAATAASADGAADSDVAASPATASPAAATSAQPRRRGTFANVDAYMGRDDTTSRAAQETLRDLFRSYVPESEDEEDGDSSRLRRCEPGKITTREDHREAKASKKAAKEAVVVKKREATYKEYERVRGVIASAAQLSEVSDASKLKNLTMPCLLLFIEMRTCKKPVGGKNKAHYVDEASAVFGQECRLALGSMPEGFSAWAAPADAAP